MKYKGFEINQTTTYTEITRYYYNRPYKAYANLYEIVGLKDCGKHPYLTSVAACKEYINEHIDNQKRQDEFYNSDYWK